MNGNAPAGPAAPASPWRAVVAFVALFAGTRVLFAVAGLRFCDEHVASIMHFPELDLLRDRLGETLWHLHGQPPLPSLMLGVLQKLAPTAWPQWLAGLLHALGAAAGASLVLVAMRAGWSAASAVAIAIAFVCLPGFVVYEHYAFTTVPVAALLLMACVPLQRWTQHARVRDLVVGLVLLALVVATRNVFHLAWWLAVAALLLRGSALPWRTRAAALAVPLLLATAPFVKNLVVHGRFESSAWLGFGLARKTWHHEPLAQRVEDALAGRRSRIEGVAVFGSVEEYALAVGMPPPTGVPLLDRPRKANGEVNYHHAVVPIAAAAMQDAALRWIAARPGAYAANVVATALQVFAPATTWSPVATPRAQLGPYARIGDAVQHAPLGGGATAWLLVAAVVVAAAMPATWRVLAQRPTRRPHDPLVAVATFTFVHVVALAALLDTNEGMRLRLKVDGLLVVAALLLARRRAPQPV